MPMASDKFTIRELDEFEHLLCYASQCKVKLIRVREEISPDNTVRQFILTAARRDHGRIYRYVIDEEGVTLDDVNEWLSIAGFFAGKGEWTPESVMAATYHTAVKKPAA
jgi:hypothetical protein